MRYFFHRIDGGIDPDNEGIECADLQAARLQAILYAGAVMRDNPEYVWEGGEMRIEVADEERVLRTTLVILSVDAIDPKLLPPYSS